MGFNLFIILLCSVISFLSGLLLGKHWGKVRYKNRHKKNNKKILLG